jgi:ubiquinone/menaquinone biosynthesis C-methylase UbiE
MSNHDHPIFTRIYNLIAKLEDGGSVGRARQEVCSQLSGRVLIVGLGPGQDLHHLPASVTEVIAIEPSRPMRKAAQPEIQKAEAKGLKIHLYDEVAEDLPLEDNSVDGVLFTYVLCSVTDAAVAVSEAYRVLRPDGIVAVLEHVKGKPGTWSARSQRVVGPLWPRFGGGCHCDRDTRAELAAAGFDTSALSDEVLVNLPPVAPVVMGAARVPTADGYPKDK